MLNLKKAIQLETFFFGEYESIDTSIFGSMDMVDRFTQLNVKEEDRKE